MTAHAWNPSTQEPKDYEFEANLGYIVRSCLQKAWQCPYKTLFTRTVLGQTWSQSSVFLNRWPHPPPASRQESTALWVPATTARRGVGERLSCQLALGLNVICSEALTIVVPCSLTQCDRQEAQVNASILHPEALSGLA